MYYLGEDKVIFFSFPIKLCKYQQTWVVVIECKASQILFPQWLEGCIDYWLEKSLCVCM